METMFKSKSSKVNEPVFPVYKTTKPKKVQKLMLINGKVNGNCNWGPQLRFTFFYH